MASEREQSAQDPQPRTAPSNDPRDTLRLFPPPLHVGATSIGGADSSQVSGIAVQSSESPRVEATSPASELEPIVAESVASVATGNQCEPQQPVPTEAARGGSDASTVRASEACKAALATEEFEASPSGAFDEKQWMNSYRPPLNYGTHEADSSEQTVHRGERRRKPAVIAFAATATLVCAIGVGAARRMAPLTGRSVNQYPATALTILPVLAATPSLALATAESSAQTRPPQAPLSGIPSSPHATGLNAPSSSGVARPSLTPQALSPTRQPRTPSMSVTTGHEPLHPGQSVRHPSGERQSVRHPPGETEPATHGVTEPVRGIKVSDVYINERGELVDAQGRSLDSH